MNDSKVKKQIIDKIKDSNNVLVALNNNPTVDELSAALGLTLAINKIDKHATAVFSGDIPAAIEFLEPEKTFENTVLSLQDFIIALDKEKADHLRYKVEGDMVKIFITPYRTTIDEHDLEFSQGDYNVDFVLAIGVQDKDSLDKALESHGQILDDATVASVGLEQPSSLGSINWNDKNASSYCEIVAGLVKDLKADNGVLDEQIATALLTGIVAATDRFSNAKTSSRVMTTAADLMSAGANQQLIAVQLQKADEISSNDSAPSAPAALAETHDEPAQKGTNGELSIDHELQGDVDQVAGQVQAANQAAAEREAEEELSRQLHPQPEAVLPPVQPPVEYEETPVPQPQQGPQVEPLLGGTLNATTEEAAEEGRRELESDQNRTILSHDSGHYITDQPSYQAPISAATDAGSNGEPEVQDIFAAGPMAQPAPEIHDLHTQADLPPLAPPAALAPTPVQPAAPFNPFAPADTTPFGTPAPVAPAHDEPTLAEIDAQNRGHADLLGDVHAAFAGQPPQVNPAANGGLPPLPPMPPMPDLGTLPPLPGTPAAPSAPGIPSEPLGSTLPPADVPPDADKSDPSQFRIPGM